MWAAGVVDLKMNAGDFWDLTPAEFDKLFNRYLEAEYRQNQRAAMICSYVANMAGKQLPDGVQVSMADILGSESAPRTELENFRMTADRSLDDLVRELRSTDPLAETTLAYSQIELAAPGVGKWSKLGTREGLMQPLNIALVMAGKKPIQ